MSKEPTVTAEVAEAEFERLLEGYDLLIDEREMNEDELASFGVQKKRLLRAIQYGRLTIDDDGLATYTPYRPGTKHKEPILFRERSGADLRAMDNSKSSQTVGKMYAMLGSLCGVHPSVFYNMVGEDIKVCEALFALLMA